MSDLSELATSRPHVVVVGGGYAGTVAANHLRMRDDVDITLVNSRPVFVERIRLHQLAAGTGTATVDYDTLLGAGVQLVVDTVERIDAADRKVVLSSGTQLTYDYLIYAVGSTAGAPSVPGAAEYAHSVADLEAPNGCVTCWPINAPTRRSPWSAAASPASRRHPNWPSKAAGSPWSAATSWVRR